jgi:hypothetical protein
MVLLAGLMFTIGMFTWTTGADGPTEARVNRIYINNGGFDLGTTLGVTSV